MALCWTRGARQRDTSGGERVLIFARRFVSKIYSTLSSLERAAIMHNLCVRLSSSEYSFMSRVNWKGRARRCVLGVERRGARLNASSSFICERTTLCANNTRLVVYTCAMCRSSSAGNACRTAEQRHYAIRWRVLSRVRPLRPARLISN